MRRSSYIVESERRSLFFFECRQFLKAWWEVEARPMPLGMFSNKYRKQFHRYGILIGEVGGRREILRRCSLMIIRGPSQKRQWIWLLSEWERLSEGAQAWCRQFGDLKGYFGIPYKNQ